MPTSYEAQKNALHSQADAYAKSFGLSGAHNGSWDAFRHAYVSAEMTRIYGAGTAKLLGDANEIYGQFSHGQPWQEKNMDLWNNKAGRDIGARSSSSAESARRAMNALDNKSLITDPEHDGRRHNTGQPATNDKDPEVCCEECGAANTFPPPPWPPSPGETASYEDGSTLYIPIVDVTPVPIPVFGAAGRASMALSTEHAHTDMSKAEPEALQAKADPEPLQAKIDNAMALVAETHFDGVHATQPETVAEQVLDHSSVTWDHQREPELALG